MGAMDFVNAAGAKIRFSRVKRQSARTLANMIGPEGVVGASNYNTHYKTIKTHLDADDYPAAEGYMKSQRAKVYQSRLKPKN